MKNILLAVGLWAVASVSAHAAVTLNAANFTNANNGIAITNSSGSLVPNGGAFWAAVTFAPGFNFSTSTDAGIASGFTLVSTVGNLAPGLSGLFNESVTYEGGTTGAPSSVVGQNIYILVGNNANLASSTAFIVFNAGATFASGDISGSGNLSAFVANANQVVYGQTSGAPNQQPNPAFNLQNSVILAPNVIPEPSTAILGAIGALGLLRRRR